MGSLVVALYLFNQFGSLDTGLRYESFHDCFEATAKLSVEANTDAQSFVKNMQDNPDLNWSNGRPTNDEISCALQKNLAGRLELSYRAGSASVHPEMMTLRIIAEQPSNKPTRQATVCRIANVTSSTVSRHVKSLKEQELLHQGDILEPTRYGFLALHEVWPDDFLCPEGLKMGDRPESPF